MKNGADNSELRSKYEKYSKAAERVAFLIIVGLAVEIAAVFILKKPACEAALTIAATSLIAIGVWGEVLLEKRAKEAADGIVALAQIEAIEATKRAKNAELQLHIFRLPRRDVLSGKGDIITERLRPFSGTQFDCGMSQGGEQADFWWDLEPSLVAAGWQHIVWQYPPGMPALMISQGPELPASGSVGAANVEIHLHPEHRQALLPAADALIHVLNEIGIAARDAGFNTHSVNANAIHILIGPKG